MCTPKYRTSRLLGRFFYLNCEHVLFVYILKHKQKKVRGFHKKFADVQDLRKIYKNRKLLNTNFF